MKVRGQQRYGVVTPTSHANERSNGQAQRVCRFSLVVWCQFSTHRSYVRTINFQRLSSGAAHKCRGRDCFSILQASGRILRCGVASFFVSRGSRLSVACLGNCDT
mmetsp:Transcript_55078/g.126492  ORF Transcript_55078/g.126492 Transcript_55078/m.126492 type:complete len:105 (+) Transcript_55078:53-367(+)